MPFKAYAYSGSPADGVKFLVGLDWAAPEVRIGIPMEAMAITDSRSMQDFCTEYDTYDLIERNDKDLIYSLRRR